jgi:hypothetical protein
MAFCQHCTKAADHSDEGRQRVYGEVPSIGERMDYFQRTAKPRQKKWLLKWLNASRLMHCDTQSCTCQHKITELESFDAPK